MKPPLEKALDRHGRMYGQQHNNIEPLTTNKFERTTEMNDQQNYVSDAVSDAQRIALEYLDQMVEMIRKCGKLTKWADDTYYPGIDDELWQTMCDSEYTLTEADQLLNELKDYLETDEGLWEAQQPRIAISTQAAYTYRNAVQGFWGNIVEDINRDINEGVICDMLIDDQNDDMLKERIKKIIEEF